MDVRLTIALAGGRNVTIPALSSPAIDLPVGVFPTWMTHVPLAAGIDCIYAIASPLGMVPATAGASANDSTISVWYATNGVRSEFNFNLTTSSGEQLAYTCNSTVAICVMQDGSLFVRNVTPGLGVAFVLTGSKSATLSFVVLDEVTSTRAWIAQLGETPTLMLSDASASFLLTEPPLPRDAPEATSATAQISLLSEGLGAPASLWVLPNPRGAVSVMGGDVLESAIDGAFSRYTVPLPSASVSITASLVTPAGPPRVLHKGKSGVAAGPGLDGALGDFKSAGVWTLQISGAQVPGVEVRCCCGGRTGVLTEQRYSLHLG